MKPQRNRNRHSIAPKTIPFITQTLTSKERRLVKKYGKNILNKDLAQKMNYDPPSYRDFRKTSTGKIMEQSMCINAISDLSTNSNNALFQESIMSQKLPPTDTELLFRLPNILINKDEQHKQYIVDDIRYTNKPTLEVVIDNLTPNVLTINQSIKDEINEIDITKNPIYFVIVSPIPHVTLLIIHEGNLYSVGYGFYDDQLKSDEKHRYDILNGAIYSADYLTPTEQHQCKIIWMGYLTSAILTNLENEFKKTTKIIYEGTKDSGVITLSDHCTLISTSKYGELASITPSLFNLNNCLTWVEKIININLRCGAINNPTNCKEITPEEFQTFKTLYRSGSSELQTHINSITNRLGRWIGGKKTKKRKITNKCKTNKRKPFLHF